MRTMESVEDSRAGIVIRAAWYVGYVGWIKEKPWSRRTNATDNIHAGVQGCQCGQQTPTCSER